MIGVGKLGQDCAEVMSEHYDVVGYDVATRSPSFPMKSTIQEAVSGRDIIFIAAPTPHDPIYGGETPTSHLPNKDFDYSIVTDILTEVNRHVKQHQLVVLISTVLPGTVRNILKPCITNARFIYNPYLIAMGSIKWDMVNPEMIIIGTENGSLTGDADELINFYKTFMQNDPRYEIGTWDEAESIKIFYNTFISTKLALVNMIQDVAQVNGNINSDVVTGALARSTQRIMGPQYMTAGMGDGGACHPRDNIALRFLAERLDLGYDLFDSIMRSREVQAENMAKYCLKYGSNVTIVGKAYKPGVSYTNGSSSLLVGHYIEKLGGTVNYYDIHTDDLDLRSDWTHVYLIGYIEDYILNIQFSKNCTIIDPWRKLQANNIISYGNTRKNNLDIPYDVSSVFTDNGMDKLLSIWPELIPHKNNIHIIYAGPITEYNFETRSTFSIIDEINHAIKQGKNKIIFNNFSESITSHSLRKAQTIVNSMSHYHDSRNFFYVCAAVDGQIAYDKFIEKNKHNYKMNIMTCNSFENIMKLHYNGMKNINEYQVKIKNKKFLCLNRMPRNVRLELIAKFIRLNLLDYGYCSLGRIDDHGWIDDLSHDPPGMLNITNETRNILLTNKSILPLKVNMSLDKSNPTSVDSEDLEYYNNSYFSVITETLYYKLTRASLTVEESRFFSEKTYKSIIAKHPFIMVGYPHSLQFLRDSGYKTFSPYINESYDSIEDDDLRLIAIINEIQRLCQMTDDEWIIWQTNIKEIVEHNHTMLLSKSDYRITRDVEKLFIGESVGF